MKRRKQQLMRNVFLVVILGLSPVIFGGSLEPDGPPAPTMKTLDEVEPRIPISQDDIPLTITQEGSYYLTEDVTASASAIIVEVNDVTIDLMGYRLLGSGAGYGVYINGQTNVEVRNGTVHGFYTGIYEYSSSLRNHRVINVRAVSNAFYGIRLSGYGNLVRDCTVAENGYYGISGGTGALVTGNISYNNQGGGIGAGNGSTVIGNTAINNDTYGIYAGNGCTVSNNTSYGNQSWGIRGGYGSNVSGNTSRDNQNTGIQADNGCTVTGNTVYNNNGDGINAYNGSTVKGNTAYGNQASGIYVYTGGSVIGNTSYDNQNYGIYLAGNSLADQNTSYWNNRSGGGYSNMNSCGTCTITSSNHAP